MGFESVYRILQELFPQVDARLLKAVAIEHSEDPDEAVEFILTDVIPRTVEKFDASSPANRTIGSSVECDERQCSSACASSSKQEFATACKAANGSEVIKAPHDIHSPCSNERVQDLLGSTFYDAKDFNDQLSEYAGSKELTTSKTWEKTHRGISVFPTIGDIDIGDCSQETENSKCGETSKLHKYQDFVLPTVALSASSNPSLHRDSVSDISLINKNQDISTFPGFENIDIGDCSQEPENNNCGETSELQKYRGLDLPTVVAVSALSTPSLLEDAVLDVSLNDKSNDNSGSDCGPLSNDNSGSDCDPLSVDLTAAVYSESQKSQHGSNYVDLALLSVRDHTLESLNCSIQSNFGSVITGPNPGILELSCNDGNTLREAIQVLDNANIEESSGLHTINTQSGQVCHTDLLENIIEDTESHKKSLLSDMESILKLMKEVEFQENAAEQAKKEASKGGLEIREKVDELNRMLNCAKEANDMHSGEVYGERAILATEMKELQSRLLALSVLKEKSLSILDVMRQTLEARLTAAEMERITAEQEKHEREESAWKTLAEQELIMEKVVQESKILQQEAAENARLREFLMDCGRVVDTLQGEISVICQDVQLLKEKFDNRVALSESFSSEQTSCILASSGSARKSTNSDQLLKHDKPSTTASIESLLSSSIESLASSGKQATTDTHNELLDGWELF